MKSVLQENKECWVCGRVDVHEHHIFYGTSNRKISEKHGLKVWLCPFHHNMSDQGVHFNPALNRRLRQMAQAYYEANIGTHDAFIKEFGKNYL